MTALARTFLLIGALLGGSIVVAAQNSAPAPTVNFDAGAAARYLDSRADAWSVWPNAQRDRGTFCLSCHTTLPYLLARPALREALGEREPAASESKILNNLLTRAHNWRDVEPFYPDQTRGIPKTSESRAIEAVMNAVILSRRDARGGRLADDTRTALDVMWSLQMKTGPNSGAWTWLNFNYEPWESPDSPYFGASLAALAAGSAPDGYAALPENQERIKALRGYFAKHHGLVSLFNQLMGLWAAGSIPDLLTQQQRKATIDATLALQQADGGWSASSLGTYQRVDKTANETKSDGFGTALATLALQASGVEDLRLTKGLDWLRHNQDRATGRWMATSLNKQRDSATEAGKFMDDAATAYAVLSLTYGNGKGNDGVVTSSVEIDGVPLRTRSSLPKQRDSSVPVVVFESGAGMPLETWDPILEKVAAFAPVLAYDRPGTGQSPWSGHSLTPLSANQRLKKLLDSLAITSPVILVGHSWGGALSRYFAGEYPQQVKAILYIDPTDVTMTLPVWQQVFASFGATSKDLDAFFANMDRSTKDLAPAVRAESVMLMELLRTPTVEERGLKPMPKIAASVLMASRIAPIPKGMVPFDGAAYVKALQATRIDRVRQWTQEGGRFAVVDGTGHFVHSDAPDVVVKEIHRLVDDTRTRSR